MWWRTTPSPDAAELRRQLAGLRNFVEFLREGQVPSSLELLNQYLSGAERLLFEASVEPDVFNAIEAARRNLTRARFHAEELRESLGDIANLLESFIIPALERRLKELEKLQPRLFEG